MIGLVQPQIFLLDLQREYIKAIRAALETCPDCSTSIFAASQRAALRSSSSSSSSSIDSSSSSRLTSAFERFSTSPSSSSSSSSEQFEVGRRSKYPESSRSSISRTGEEEATEDGEGHRIDSVRTVRRAIAPRRSSRSTQFFSLVAKRRCLFETTC